MLPRRALISVHDETHLDDFVRALQDMGCDVIASEQNAASLALRGVGVRSTADALSRPVGAAMRVQTLDARVHAGIIAGETPQDAAALGALGAVPIDLVAVNLPPIAAQGDLEALLASIDLDRPALLRSAAVNHARVIVVVDPEDYGRVIKALTDYDEVSAKKRREFALRALAVLARYDAAVARLASSFDENGERRATPELFALVAERATDLRGGDNVQQAASLYADAVTPPGTLPQALMLGTGDAETPTFAQLREAQAAIDLVAEMTRPTAALLARGRPVSVVTASSIADAIAGAMRGAPAELSSPLLVCNDQVDAASMQSLLRTPVQTIVAPSFHVEAVDALQAASPGPTVIATRALPPPARAGVEALVISGGVLVEARDATADGEVARGKVVSQRQPTEREVRALEFAWKVAKHASSDAVVVAREDDDGTLRTVGIASAAPSRAHAVQLALALAGPAAAQAVLASDAALDTRAEIDAILARGVLAVAHPGSANDVANVSGGTHVLALVATGTTHFHA